MERYLNAIRLLLLPQKVIFFKQIAKKDSRCKEKGQGFRFLGAQYFDN